MKKRISAYDLVNSTQPDVQLTYKHALFVIEYLKDGGVRRAAEASGHSPDYGQTLIERPDIQASIDYILAQRLDSALVDSEWLLGELVDNHMIARQRGQIGASTTALINIGKHKQVDAFVAKELKVELNTNDELLSRLQRGRERNSKPSDESFM